MEITLPSVSLSYVAPYERALAPAFGDGVRNLLTGRVFQDWESKFLVAMTAAHVVAATLFFFSGYFFWAGIMIGSVFIEGVIQEKLRNFASWRQTLGEQRKHADHAQLHAYALRRLKDEYAHENDRYAKLNAQLTEQNDRLTKENDRYTALNDQLAELNGQYAEENAHFAEQNQRLSTRVSELKRANKDYRVLNREHEALNRELGEETGVLRGQLDQFADQLLQHQIITEEAHQNYREWRAGHKEAIGEIQAEAEALKQISIDFGGATLRLSEQVLSLKGTAEELSAQKGRLDAEVGRLETVRGQLDEKVRELNGSIGRLESEVGALRGLNQEMARSWEALKAERVEHGKALALWEQAKGSIAQLIRETRPQIGAEKLSDAIFAEIRRIAAPPLLN